MMIQSGPEIGYSRLSASAILGTSGAAVAIYGYGITSGATAGVLSFFNGTSSLGSIVIQETGTISVSKSFPLGCGVVFPSGAYASFDGNVTSAVVFFRQVRTSAAS